MTTNYPSSLDSLTNPTASDSLGSATVPHATNTLMLTMLLLLLKQFWVLVLPVLELQQLLTVLLD